MQVYRDLCIVTARPSAAEMEQVPHRLYGVLDAAERCSVARWRDMARAEIALALGKRYSQDTPLRWGSALAQAKEDLDRLKAAGATLRARHEKKRPGS